MEIHPNIQQETTIDIARKETTIDIARKETTTTIECPTTTIECPVVYIYYVGSLYTYIAKLEPQ